MNWTELKNRIYFEDGSLRDIYVFETDINDWKKWADLVNEKYVVEFFDAKTNSTKDKIDFEAVRECWSDFDREVVTATVKLVTINIKCYFFGDSEIENDIDPGEFKTIEDHNNLLSYLKDISVSVDKDVFVTEENTPDSILISGKSGEFIFNSA
jgi:hypothetical protein